MSKLAIYRASAGSGKTYALTYNYIRLALATPDNFKSILAVTFTNKATEEMKSRIIETLHALSEGEHPMSQDLMTVLDIDLKTLQERAKQLQSNILHHYSYFAVSTIDTFFQKVVRSFAREMGIHAGFKVELDQRKVLREVIEDMVVNLAEDKQLLRWLTEYAIHQVNEGKQWDTNRAIQTLSEELFKEEIIINKDVIFEKMDDLDFMPSFIQRIFKEKKRIEREYQNLGKEAVKIYESVGLNTLDFSYGIAGVGGYMLKVSEGEFKESGKRVISALEEGAWCTKSSTKKDDIDTALSIGLDIAVANMVTFYQQNHSRYTTFQLSVNYLYAYGVISKVSKAIDQYREDNELLLISDFAVFLNEIINESDTPYVYEKIGTRFNHYLIDEFQDTSGMQWGNFRPLIAESLASSNFNMLVGDVKQSIYRWRGGNWKILLDQVQKEVDPALIEKHELSTNRRSKEPIVTFNNAFFENAPKLLESELSTKIDSVEILKLAEAYKGVAQHPFNTSENCLIDMHFINKKTEEEDIDEVIFARLINNLQELQDHNYALGDITILVRKKSEGKKVTDFLMKYQSDHPKDGYRYDVISNEALYLKNNPAIHLLIQCLQLSINKKEKLHLVQLRYAVMHHFGLGVDAELTILQFVNKLDGRVDHTVTNMINLIIDHFDLYSYQKDLPYLMAFQDAVLDYLKYELDSIAQFLTWWETNGTRSIQVSDQQDCISLMTVHKSKGLQFKVVMIPFCNWALDHKVEQILWCKTGDVEAMKEVPYLPVRYTSKMAESNFKSDYFQEKNDIHLDNLNLLYVALTRAEEVMYLTCPYSPPKGSGIDAVSNLLLKHSEKAYADHVTESAELSTIRIGKLVGYSAYQGDKVNAMTLKPRSSDVMVKDRLVFKSGFSILGEDQQRSIDFGEIVHWIYSQISIKRDFASALDKAVLKFSMTKDELNELKMLLRQVWELPYVSEWFSDHWQVKNESSILLENGKMKRPDRVIFEQKKAVVIDYKTGKKSASHIKQVEDYKSLLIRMGFENVQGYLLYLSSQEVVKV